MKTLMKLMYRYYRLAPAAAVPSTSSEERAEYDRLHAIADKHREACEAAGVSIFDPAAGAEANQAISAVIACQIRYLVFNPQGVVPLMTDDDLLEYLRLYAIAQEGAHLLLPPDED
ncbi:hypothetical protein [Streptomyces boninensis]|uniref:hypothetical protein n=1 Tax=Streptomyces boninensis TaxID=2039455 RepID=UPI003B22127C